jgi:hypothetical protein
MFTSMVMNIFKIMVMSLKMRFLLQNNSLMELTVLIVLNGSIKLKMETSIKDYQNLNKVKKFINLLLEHLENILMIFVIQTLIRLKEHFCMEKMCIMDLDW